MISFAKRKSSRCVAIDSKSTPFRFVVSFRVQVTANDFAKNYMPHVSYRAAVQRLFLRFETTIELKMVDEKAMVTSHVHDPWSTAMFTSSRSSDRGRSVFDPLLFHPFDTKREIANTYEITALKFTYARKWLALRKVMARRARLLQHGVILIA
jgi:hypothetical protein